MKATRYYMKAERGTRAGCGGLREATGEDGE